MKKIKSYKLFENKDTDEFIEAKRIVDEALIPLTDAGITVDVINDNFPEQKEGLNCFSVIIEKRETREQYGNNVIVTVDMDFQSILDDIWHAFSSVDDYGFYFYVLSYNENPGGRRVYWSPLDIVDIEERLEKVNKVNQIIMSFTKKGMFEDRIESNKKSKNTTVSEVQYK